MVNAHFNEQPTSLSWLLKYPSIHPITNYCIKMVTLQSWMNTILQTRLSVDSQTNDWMIQQHKTMFYRLLKSGAKFVQRTRQTTPSSSTNQLTKNYTRKCLHTSLWQHPSLWIVSESMVLWLALPSRSLNPRAWLDSCRFMDLKPSILVLPKLKMLKTRSQPRLTRLTKMMNNFSLPPRYTQYIFTAKIKKELVFAIYFVILFNWFSMEFTGQKNDFKRIANQEIPSSDNRFRAGWSYCRHLPGPCKP